MVTEAPSRGVVLVTSLFALSCICLILFVWSTIGGNVPLQAKGYRFKALFPDASQLNTQNQALSGSSLVNTLNDMFTRQFRFGFLVEQTPEDSNTVTLSTTATDHLGLPRPQINYNLSEYTVKGLLAAQQTATTLFKQLGAKEYTTPADANDPSAAPAPGQPNGRIKYFGSGHVVGTYAMGSDKTKSVCDPNQRSWDHPNLFLTGSGVFPTVATANPTLTLAALSLMAANAILTSDLK